MACPARRCARHERENLAARMTTDSSSSEVALDEGDPRDGFVSLAMGPTSPYKYRALILQVTPGAENKFGALNFTGQPTK
jgi:hypothetical protein